MAVEDWMLLIGGDWTQLVEGIVQLRLYKGSNFVLRDPIVPIQIGLTGLKSHSQEVSELSSAKGFLLDTA